MTQTMVGLKTHSINLYKRAARRSPPIPSAIATAMAAFRLANTEAQMDGYRHFASMARGMGVDL